MHLVQWSVINVCSNIAATLQYERILYSER